MSWRFVKTKGKKVLLVTEYTIPILADADQVEDRLNKISVGEKGVKWRKCEADRVKPQILLTGKYDENIFQFRERIRERAGV